MNGINISDNYLIMGGGALLLFTIGLRLIRYSKKLVMAALFGSLLMGNQSYKDFNLMNLAKNNQLTLDNLVHSSPYYLNIMQEFFNKNINCSSGNTANDEISCGKFAKTFKDAGLLENNDLSDDKLIKAIEAFYVNFEVNNKP